MASSSSGGGCVGGQASLSFSQAISSGSDDDGPVVNMCGQPRVTPRGQKRSVADMVLADGPLLCVWLIGQPLRGARWCAEVQHGSQASTALHRALVAVAGQAADALPADRAIVAGVAIVRAWRFVRGAVSHEHVWMMTEACQRCHSQRSGQRFIEHEVLASATISAASGGFIVAPEEWLALPARLAGERIRSHLSAVSAQAQITKGGVQGVIRDVQGLLDSWFLAHDLASSAAMLAWPVTSLLALGLASGSWFGDVSVKHRRMRAEEVTMAPVSMSAKTIRHFLEMDVQLLPPVSLSRNGQIWDRKKGFVKAYTSEHMLGMLRAGQHVVDRQKLTANLKNAVVF